MKLPHSAVLLTAVILGSTLTSCSLLLPAPQTCVSWADVSDPQTAYDDAEGVVIGSLEATRRTVKLFGVNAAVHELRITEVVTGEFGGADTLRVAATPVTCTGGDVYPDGDPLDVAGEQIVFLSSPESGKTWRLLTPYGTVLPVPADGTLPFTVRTLGG